MERMADIDVQRIDRAIAAIRGELDGYVKKCDADRKDLREALSVATKSIKTWSFLGGAAGTIAWQVFQTFVLHRLADMNSFWRDDTAFR